MARERQDSQIEWTERLARWKRSSLTRQEFAQREGVSPEQLTWWKGRLRTLQCDAPAAETPLFVELKGPSAGVGVELVMRSGAVMRVPVGFDEDTVARLVRVLDGEAP